MALPNLHHHAGYRSKLAGVPRAADLRILPAWGIGRALGNAGFHFLGLAAQDDDPFGCRRCSDRGLASCYAPLPLRGCLFATPAVTPGHWSLGGVYGGHFLMTPLEHAEPFLYPDDGRCPRCQRSRHDAPLNSNGARPYLAHRSLASFPLNLRLCNVWHYSCYTAGQELQPPTTPDARSHL
jgi:hypothetical protein